MSNPIGSLIDPTVAERMRSIASLSTEAPAKPVQAKKVSAKDKVNGRGYRTVKSATEPNPPRPLTVADAIVIDPESEAMIEATCVDCDTPLLIDPKVPDGVDPNTPRVPICQVHGEARATFDAVVNQRQVEIVRRNQQAARGTTHQEAPVIDLNETPDAEVGAAVKKSMKVKKVKQIKADRTKAVAKQAKADKKARKAVKREQKARHTLPGFVVDGSLSIEPFDTGTHPLDEAPSAMERRPYNQARFRLEGSPALFPPLKDDEEIPENYVATTYRLLATEHVRLAALAKVKQTAKAEPKKKAKKVVAVVDLDAKAKALANFTGVSKKRAREILSQR